MVPVQAILSVKPIYGWGWVGAPPNPVRKPPEPFAFLPSRMSAGEWEGVVQTPGHEFDEQRVSLTQRHLEWDGCVNVTIGAEEAPITEGWAMVVDHNRLQGKR